MSEIPAPAHGLRAFLDSIQDPVVIFDSEDERVLDVNDRACEMYGRGREDLIGSRLPIFGDDVERARNVA